MTGLLDVNVLVALFDPSHVHHEKAHAWFGQEGGTGWASCPITENGFVRVISNPKYGGRRTTVGDAIHRLRVFRQAGRHAFWPDGFSILDPTLFDASRLSGHRQLTDAYLLGLAVRNDGRLVTFDRSIPTEAVVGARPDHLVLL